jgi:hypothetical protein
MNRDPSDAMPIPRHDSTEALRDHRPSQGQDARSARETHRGPVASVDSGVDPRGFLRSVKTHYVDVTRHEAIPQGDRNEDADARIAARIRQWIQSLAFLRLAELRGFHANSHCGLLEEGVNGFAQPASGLSARRAHVFRLWQAAWQQWGPSVFHAPSDELQSPNVSGGETFLRNEANRAVDSAVEWLWDERRRAEWSALPATILGRIHETLLHASPLSTATRVAKRSHGVYYTPECVARHMAREAFDDLRRRGVARPWRILDPACGGGVFLVAALRELLERRPEASGANDLPALVSQLFGFDLDHEAVVIARQTLLLELLAAYGPEVAPNGDPWPWKAVADALQRNVRPANFLDDTIEPSAEGGGFDAILGNPPYHRELNAKTLLDSIAATRLGQRYRTSRMDLSYYFMHRALECLRPGGVLSFIVGAYWTAGCGASRLIEQLRDTCHLSDVLLLGSTRVFDGVSGRHMILRAVRGPCGPTTIRRVRHEGASEIAAVLADPDAMETYAKTHAQVFRRGQIDVEPPSDESASMAGRTEPLARLGTIRQGIVENPASVTRKNLKERRDGPWRVGDGVFALSHDELARLAIPDSERTILRPYHDLCDLGRYFIASEPTLTLIYATARTCPDLRPFPTIAAHLERFRPIMEARRETQAGDRPWWQLHWPRDETLWRSAKIVALQMAARPAFAPAVGPLYVPFSANVFVPHARNRESLFYYAAVLNSRWASDWFGRHAKRRGVGLEINGHVLAEFPMRIVDRARSDERRMHDRIADLAQKVMTFVAPSRPAKASSVALQAGAAAAATSTVARSAPLAARQAQAAAIDAEIDRLVDAIYETDSPINGSDASAGSDSR